MDKNSKPTRKSLSTAGKPVEPNQVPGAPSDRRRSVPLWAQLLVWAGLLVVLGLLAIGLLRTQQGTISVGQAVQNFTLSISRNPLVEGQDEIQLADLRGKVVVINFWASWCKPCEQEAAELEAAWRYYQERGDVVFLGISYADTEPEAHAYLAKFGITYPNGPDLGTRISQAFRAQGVPETYFIDRQGILRYIKIGPFESLDAILAVIEPLLASE